MKANEAPENNKRKAPDKIYAYFGVFGLVQATEIRATPKYIEYIRKDAFIEKACSWLKENKDKYLYNAGEKGEYIPTCSGKMIDEFKKYMEE